MKRLTIILVILLFSNFSFGQKNKTSIGFFYSLDKYDFEFERSTGLYHNYEINSSYSVGLNVKWNFSERLFINGAIQYAERGYKLDYDFDIMEPGDPLIPRRTTIDLNYFGIPLFLGYDLYNGDKLKIAPSMGLVNEFLIKDKEKSTFEDSRESESEILHQDLNKYLISLQLNIAFEYHISDKIFLNLEPFLRTGFNAIDEEMVKSNTFSYGGILGINYKLK